MREIAQAAGLELAALEKLLNRAVRVGLATRVAPNRVLPACRDRAARGDRRSACRRSARRAVRTPQGFRGRLGARPQPDDRGAGVLRQGPAFTRRIGQGRRILKPAADLFGTPPPA
ncbi:MAG: hypothetical protein WDO24_00250 [Pseudomonadota bacterium]